MKKGIDIRILGDFGPFSKVGKSIGYRLRHGESTYMIDCGAPPFLQTTDQDLTCIDGMVITHCHDDHKRWLTDIALFCFYESKPAKKILLMTSEDVRDEIIRASGPALNRSLSDDSKNVIDISCEDYIDFKIIGPKARYRITSLNEGNGRTALHVTDRKGNIIGPDKAKIIINKKTGRPRMLFYDPDYREWVEPESFYPYTSTVFYEDDRNIYKDKEGLTFEAVKAPVWHGISGIGLKIYTGKETLVLSSDTVHDKKLWEELASEKREQRLAMTEEEFKAASVIYGDINDYIERAWSKERYMEAITAFNDAIVIHDISSMDSIVHTDYNRLDNTFLNKESAMLTHSPDIITSEWVLCGIDKTYKIIENSFYEIVDNRLYPMDADIYYRDGEKYCVGYKNENGNFIIYEENSLLKLSADNGNNDITPLYRVDLYEDISGKYLPCIKDKDSMYVKRSDGKIELVRVTPEGSSGTIAKNLRDELMKKKKFTGTGEFIKENKPLASY